MTLRNERSVADRQLKIRPIHGALSNITWGEKAKVRLTRVEEHVHTQKKRGGV